MQDTQGTTPAPAEGAEKPAMKKARAASRQPSTVSSKIFKLILKYKESKLFTWVNRNYVLSLVIVTVWGMVIVGAFLFFVIYTVLQQNPGQ
ncbi:MAG: hypothetical protein KBA61_15485 [Spirochaetes bacterium]|nr:hypothetical protein [Spirochaetota bacterium]HPA73872.1 hypothetical protein [Spirochaetota bacterium]